MIYKDLRQLKFVTSNADKVREATDIMGFSLDQISSLSIDEVQSDDISKVVIHKAKQSYDIVKLPVLVEDSGLFFTAWNGLPGPFIKWFETSVGCQGLLKMIDVNMCITKCVHKITNFQITDLCHHHGK